MKKKTVSRRKVLATTAVATPFMIVPPHVLGGPRHIPPSEKLNIAAIGCGGMGRADLRNLAKENIVALCDVDSVRAAKSFKEHPKAKKYKDFRKMLEKEGKHIDAVQVSTPDHTHAVAGMAVLKAGKHLYCQKPLAHNLFDVRALTEEAKKTGLVTQMGIQIHATDGMKSAVEIIKSGMIGKVHHVDIWSCKGREPGKVLRKNPATKPMPKMPTPSTLDWDLWVGPAQFRPYNKAYCPHAWRKWWEFGSGRLGDMACHILDPVFWSLDLKSPTHIEASPTEFTDQVYPDSNMVVWSFAARGTQPAVTVKWYDGANLNKIPVPKEAKGFKIPNQGGMYYGDKGVLFVPHFTGKGKKIRLFPASKFEGIKAPQLFKRRTNHWHEWIDACKSGGKTSAPFDYAGPLTEAVLLGNVATLARKKIAWDPVKMKITNDSAANAYLRAKYRKGWSL